MVRVQSTVVLPHALQSIAFMVLAVGAVARVDQEEGGALGNVKVGVILVREVGLECTHSSTLVTVTYADQLVCVASAPRSKPHNFSKLRELGSDLPERADVQVQKRDAKMCSTLI